MRLEHYERIYREARNSLAAFLIGRPIPAAPDAEAARRLRVERVAYLLWHNAGRPAGTAESDWNRAEQLISAS